MATERRPFHQFLEEELEFILVGVRARLDRLWGEFTDSALEVQMEVAERFSHAELPPEPLERLAALCGEIAEVTGRGRKFQSITVMARRMTDDLIGRLAATASRL